MREVTKYIAEDGTEFASPVNANNHEILCFDVQRAENHLIARPGTREFLDSGAFIQQMKPVVLVFQRFLIREFHKARPDVEFPVEEYLAAEVPVGMHYLGRVVSEAAPGPIKSAWWRLQCMDEQFREYDQPFFAIEANKAKGR